MIRQQDSLIDAGTISVARDWKAAEKRLSSGSNGPWLEAWAGVLIKATQCQTKEPRNLVETAFAEAVKQAAEISLPLLSTQVECRLPKCLRSHSLQFVPTNSHWHRCKGALPNQQKHPRI
ncbi:hypothetical protein OAK65_04195 [Synechococcus sp. AH-551-N17]|nr:hypothetical protein [Synechococcus sp. AH-551-N17]